MYSLIQRDMQAQRKTEDGTTRRSSDSSETSQITVPELFTDPGYNLLATSVLSTSNCGNPALRLFGFGPVTPDGYGIGTLKPVFS